MALTTERGRDLVGFAGAARAALLVELGALDDDPLGLAVALDSRPAWRRSRTPCAWACPAARSAKPRSMVTDLRRPGLERLVGFDRREIGGVDDRHGGFEMAELAKLLGSHRDLVRAAAAEDGDGADRASCRARRARGRRCPSLRTRRGSSTGSARSRARHCRCRPPPRGCRRAADRGRRNRDGRCTSRRTRPSRRRRANPRPGMPSLRSCGAPVARITAS